MRGGWRFAIAVWAAGLPLAPAPLLAQAAPTTASDTPATDAVGPRELQNFSLSGNVTRPAEPQPPQRVRPAPRASDQPAETATASETPQPRAAPRRTQVTEQTRQAPVPTAAAPARQSASTSPTAPTAPTTLTTAATAAPAPALGSSLNPQPASAPLALEPEHHLLLWPWLLAAVAAAAAAAFLLWRNRSRHAFAGGPDVDLFVAPEASPQPQPAPRPPQPAARAPQPAPAPAPPKDPLTAGLVTSSLRARLEIAVHPSRCVLTDEAVTIEFELELFNSGNAPARAIAIEGVMLNAGAEQEQELAEFFARPAIPGNRIDVIQPMNRVAFPTQVAMPRGVMQPVEMGGRDVFIPLLAFNAIYRAGSVEGQTSASFLVGRDGNGDKLGPFALNLGPRIFRGLGARALPLGVRR